MQPYPRPFLVRLLALLFAFALVAVACAPGAEPSPPAGGDVIMLSTQLNPVEEQEKMRDVILADYPGQVDFISAEAADFADRTAAEAQAGEGGGQVGVLGGVHGDLEPLAAQGHLTDLSDLAQELADLGFNDAYLELGRYGTEEQLFIPWMQATYIVAAREEAMQYLPEGANQNALT